MEEITKINIVLGFIAIISVVTIGLALITLFNYGYNQNGCDCDSPIYGTYPINGTIYLIEYPGAVCEMTPTIHNTINPKVSIFVKHENWAMGEYSDTLYLYGDGWEIHPYNIETFDIYTTVGGELFEKITLGFCLDDEQGNINVYLMGVENIW